MKIDRRGGYVPQLLDWIRGRRSGARSRAALFSDVQASFVVADAAQTPLADATADAVVCIDALQMLPEKERVLREIARVLRPGGRVVNTTWERDTASMVGREPIRDAGRLVATGGLDVLLHEERPEWMDRQTELFERAIAEDDDEAEPALRRFAAEGRQVLPLTETTRRVLVVATRPQDG